MKQLNITINSHIKTYPILIGSDLMACIDTHIDLTHYSKVAIIADENTKTYIPKIKSDIKQEVIEIILKPGEKEKNIQTVHYIWEHMTHAKLDRKSLVINVGGGVIGDMGGFAAATYMRGIDFIQIPTILLSMVDASVGGKVGINFSEIKNIIGSFQQPIAVVIDVDTLKTLPAKEFNSGFAEIIKHGLIRNKEYFAHVISKQPQEFNTEELIEIIDKSCHIKATIVQADEHEMGERKLLNFGHTIGHAIEILSANTTTPLLHGEAIAIGMIAEAKLSELQGFISKTDINTIETAMKNAQLPTRITSIPAEKIIEKLYSDKKNSHGKIKWTLLYALGEGDYNIEVGESFIQKAVEYILR